MTNVFKKEQRKFSPAEQEFVNDLRSIAEELNDRIDMIAPSRERDIAKVKLEECVMWAIKAVSQSL